MAENITRCPKCNTSFRISEKHLNTGKGAVRCGSCLNVFTARDFLVASKAVEQEIEEPELQHEENDELEKFDTDEVLISDDMDSEPSKSGISNNDVKKEFNEALFKDSDTGEYEFNLFERDALADEDDDTVPEDESWALDLLEGDDEDHSHAPTSEQIQEQEEKNITQEFDSSYYKNSFQIIDENQKEESSEHGDYDKNIGKELFTDENGYDEPKMEEYDYSEGSQQLYETSSSNERYLDSIEPEPVEFNWQQHSNFWHSKLLWTCLSLCAGLCLATQIAWVKFDSLSVVEPYRSHYARICSIFGCTLPPLIDKTKIRTANLVVRTHPKVKGALIVDAILQNTARFEQKYPVLDLVFTDSQDKAIAAKRLRPEDYLGGELTGKTHMPVKQPIHIAIEVADPGAHATGYKMTIVQ